MATAKIHNLIRRANAISKRTREIAGEMAHLDPQELERQANEVLDYLTQIDDCMPSGPAAEPDTPAGDEDAASVFERLLIRPGADLDGEMDRYRRKKQERSSTDDGGDRAELVAELTTRLKRVKLLNKKGR